MISDRLLALRREKGLSKRGLVDTIPLNYSTYANYESGFREPNVEVLVMLARYYSVSLDYIMGVSDTRKRADEIATLTTSEDEHVTKYRQLDEHGRDLVDTITQKEFDRVSMLSARSLLGHSPTTGDQWVLLKVYQQRASAGLGNYLGDDSETDYEEMRFAATPISQKADFCICIRGDSMEPKIRDGSIVFVKTVPKVEADNVGIFIYEGEAYCKRIKLDYKKQAIYLESLNKAYAPKQITRPESLHTIGVVIGIAE